MDLNQIKVRPIRLDERSRWKNLCDKHHYLGFDKKFGHQILYCVEYNDNWVGLMYPLINL